MSILRPDAGTYSLRHARISELLQVFNVDPFTVAHQTGTSLAMIIKRICDSSRKHCGKSSQGST